MDMYEVVHGLNDDYHLCTLCYINNGREIVEHPANYISTAPLVIATNYAVNHLLEKISQLEFKIDRVELKLQR
jgi:hypothetical protein